MDTTNSNHSREIVWFQCLGCKKKKFKGKRDHQTGSVECRGLMNHIKQKKDKNGFLACLEVYTHLSSSQLHTIDISTSVVDRSRKTSQSLPLMELHIPKKARISSSNDHNNTDENSMDGLTEDGEDNSCSGVNFVLKEENPLLDLILLPSNSLHKNLHFVRDPQRPKSSLSKTSKLQQEKLNKQTLPSQKLFPHISLSSIFKTMEEVKAMEAKATAFFAKTENQMGMDSQSHLLTNDEVLIDDKKLTQDGSDSSEDLTDTSISQEDKQQEDDDNTSSLSNHDDQQDHGTDIGNDNHPAFLHPDYLLDRLQYEQENSVNLSDGLPPDILSHLELLRLQDKHKFSLAAVADIQDWAHFSTKLDPDIFSDRPLSRESLMKQYRQFLGMPDHGFQFQEHLVQWLPDNKPTVLRKRPFLDCVYELLTKEELLGKNMENISLPHPTDPYSLPTMPESEFVSELHHGTWWPTTMKRKCVPGSKDIICPLIFEVDETVIDAHGKLSVTPFNIKLGIFNTETNTKVEASTTWFFLPNDSAEASNHEKTTFPVHKLQNLHNALREGFRDLKYLMDNNIAIRWKIQYGGGEELLDVNLRFAVAFIISDTAMHDKLCCHYGSRNAGVQAICRHCNCKTNDLIDYEAFVMKYRNYVPDELHPNHSSRKEYWNSVSHYPIANACDELYHGANKGKTHVNTTGEVLHMHQKGGMWRVVESLDFVWRGGKNIFLDNVSAASKQVNVKKSMENFNYLAHQIERYLNRQSDRNKPRTKFKNSLFAQTKKNAHEQAGVLMCFLLAMLTDRGRQIMLEERTMSSEFVDNYVYILELNLMVEVWLKKHKFPRKQVQDGPRLLKAFGFYLTRFSEICQRGGMGSLLVKNHLMLHLPQYIHLWGPPRGWDAANLERSHKTEAKWPAQLTQKRQDTFVQQLCNRYFELRLVRQVRQFFSVEHVLSNDLPGSTNFSFLVPKSCTGSSFQVGIDNENNEPSVKWKKNPGRQAHPQEVINFVCDAILWNIPLGQDKVIEGFTEFRSLINGERSIFRAHPSYRSASRQRRDIWYDWAKFDMSSFCGFGNNPRPGQLLMFIHVPMLNDEASVNGIRLRPGKPHSVVRLFKEDTRNDFREGFFNEDNPQESNSYSYLVEFGQVDDKLYLLPCELIVDTAIVVKNVPILPPVNVPSKTFEVRERRRLDQLISPLGPGFFVLEPREEWGEYFGRLIDSFKDTT